MGKVEINMGGSVNDGEGETWRKERMMGRRKGQLSEEG